MGSSAKGSTNPMTHTSAPKSTKEVAAAIMQAQKATELFQTMVIVNMNMEVNTLKNRLATGEKEKAILHDELDKERDFHKG